MDIPFAIPVVRVLFEFARDRASVDVGQVLLCVAEHLRVRGESSDSKERWPAAFRPTLRALERAELVEIFDDGRIRLTAGGFALAVATGATVPSTPLRRSRREVSSAHARPRLVA